MNRTSESFIFLGKLNFLHVVAHSAAAGALRVEEDNLLLRKLRSLRCELSTSL